MAKLKLTLHVDADSIEDLDKVGATSAITWVLRDALNEFWWARIAGRPFDVDGGIEDYVDERYKNQSDGFKEKKRVATLQRVQLASALIKASNDLTVEDE